jgi:hypothetical protein
MPPAAAKKTGVPPGQPAVTIPAEPAADVPEAKDEVAHPPQPPAKPQPPKLLFPEVTQTLVDIPCLFLNDRSCWADFKRALNECAISWNIPEWMTTIVYKGAEWDEIQKEHGTDLAAYFPAIEKTGAGDGITSKSSTLGVKLVALLGRPTNLGDFKPNVQYCCLSTVEFESERKLPARQKLWNWMVRSLRGNRATCGS